MLQRIAQLFRKTFTPYPLNILFKRRGQRHRHRDFHHINGVTVFPGHTLHDMPPAIFQLLNKRAGNTTVTHKHAAAHLSGMNPAPFYDACGADRTTRALPSLITGKSPRLTLILACGFLTVAVFSLALSFTSFRRTFVSRATCDADCDIADEATRLMAIAAAPGTAVLLIRLRFSTACSRPFMAIHLPLQRRRLTAGGTPRPSQR